MVKIKQKKQKIYKIGEVDYKKFRRREKQIMKLKNYFREAWRILGQLE